MGSVQIDSTQPGGGALTALTAGELCRHACWAVLVTALVAGLLGMHVLGGHGTAHSMLQMVHQLPAQTAAHQTAFPETAPHQTAARAAVARGAVVHVHDGAPAASDVECGPTQPTVPAGASAHCTPAPGAVPPAPPSVLDLARSDALPHPPAASTPDGMRPRAPAPDLSQLSISRT